MLSYTSTLLKNDFKSRLVVRDQEKLRIDYAYPFKNIQKLRRELRKSIVRLLQLLLPGPKTLFLERYYFHPRVCVCMSVSESVYHIDYLKKL